LGIAVDAINAGKEREKARKEKEEANEEKAKAEELKSGESGIVNSVKSLSGKVPGLVDDVGGSITGALKGLASRIESEANVEQGTLGRIFSNLPNVVDDATRELKAEQSRRTLEGIRKESNEREENRIFGDGKGNQGLVGELQDQFGDQLADAKAGANITRNQDGSLAIDVFAKAIQSISTQQVGAGSLQQNLQSIVDSAADRQRAIKQAESIDKIRDSMIESVKKLGLINEKVGNPRVGIIG
jgi:flagellin-like hook-associated protein FlgL